MNEQEQMQLLFPEENLDVMQDYMERFRKMIAFKPCIIVINILSQSNDLIKID